MAATLAVASVAAFGCGDDDDDDGTTAAATEEATSVETTTEATASAPGRVELVTPPGDALIFQPDTATTKAGSVTIVWDNEADIPHSICLEDPKGQLVDPPGCSAPITESNDSAEYELTSGTYTYYCDVDGHRAQGMEGTLTVQ